MKNRRSGKYSENIGIHVRISGNFGELLVSYILVTEKLHVIIADSEGVDLLIKDKEKKIFNENKLIGISVKSRKNKSHSEDLTNSIENLESASETWGFIPYFCFVIPKRVLIFPVNFAKDKKVKTEKGNFSIPRLLKFYEKKLIKFKWSIDSENYENKDIDE